jgi:Ribbon-helix-helix protein, copG family
MRTEHPITYAIHMARTETLVQLSSELIAALDVESKKRGCSRSALIRTAIEEHLDRSNEKTKIDRYVEGYRRRPQSDHDRWGQLADHDGHDMAQRLDADADADGAPW